MVFGVVEIGGVIAVGLSIYSVPSSRYFCSSCFLAHAFQDSSFVFRKTALASFLSFLLFLYFVSGILRWRSHAGQPAKNPTCEPHSSFFGSANSSAPSM